MRENAIQEIWNMNFLLDKGSEIVIYGASLMAISWAEKAVTKGFTVKVFIDRNADEIKYVKSVPVVTFESYCDTASEDDIVLIMLQNVMQHREIVEQLWLIGIKKVIFFPMRVMKNHIEKISCLRRKYNECIKLDFEDSLEIPILYDNKINDNEETIIWKDQKETIAWAPVEVCYSTLGDGEGKIWNSDYTNEAINLSKKYIYNRSLFALYPYWELFSFLNGKTDNCCTYLKIFGKEGHINNHGYDNSRLLKDRNKLVDLFRDEVCKGNNFFEQSPADSGVGERGKIVIYDGIHRSVFLIDNGYWWIPVRLSNSDYNYLFHIEAVQKLKDYLNAKGIRELQYPLEALGFYNYLVNHQYIRDVWKKFISEATNRDWKFNFVFDLSLTDGYFARMFYREGSQAIYCLLGDGNEIPLLANDIFRINNIKFVYDTNYLYMVMNKCEIIIFRIEQLLSLFYNSIFVWGNCLKCVVVYDVLIEESEAVLERIFGESRRFNLISKYVTDGIMKGMYIVE